MKNLFSFVITLCVVISSIAQKAPIKFGKVDISELEMTQCKLDTSAPAVVLCDYGYFGGDFVFRRHMRIKILKQEGLKYANHIIDAEYKSDVRGYTFNLENGEIIKDKLERSGIFVEEETEYETVMRVAMPNVRVGSIMDIEYNHYSLPFIWPFQSQIPILRSELVILPSSNIQFQMNFFGEQSLSVYESNRWVAENMPAVKEEPYITSINNCITKFEFDIYSIVRPGYSKRVIAKTWESIRSLLYRSNYFGEAMKNAGYLDKEADSIRNTTSDTVEMMIMAYESIKNRVKWNGRKSLITSSDDLESVYRDKLGNSADINLMLVQLLDKLEFEVYPVVMSTRDNGILSPVCPSLRKLNYVIALVKVEEKEYLLDATEKFLPYNILPLRDLNYQGRAMDPDTTFWVDLASDKKDKQTVFYHLTLMEDMQFDGEINIVREEFAAFEFREKYHSFNGSKEYLADFISGKAGLRIKDFGLTKLDSLMEPVTDKYDVSIINRVDVIGDEAFIYPLFYEAIPENPFKSEERENPIDFGYPVEKSMVFFISLPEEFTVTEIPKPLSLKLPNNAGSFLYQLNIMNNEIQVVCKFKLNDSFFYVDEYPGLRQFFDHIIKKQSEPIVVKVS